MVVNYSKQLLGSVNITILIAAADAEINNINICIHKKSGMGGAAPANSIIGLKLA